MSFKEMKMRVDNESHSQEVQNVLMNSGYMRLRGRYNTSNEHPFLTTTKNGIIMSHDNAHEFHALKAMEVGAKLHNAFSDGSPNISPSLEEILEEPPCLASTLENIDNRILELDEERDKLYGARINTIERINETLPDGYRLFKN